MVVMLLFNSAGYILLFYQLKKIFKKEAFSKLENFIEEKDLVEIKVSKTVYENPDENFYFVEEHEIKYYGKMYDIAKVEFSGDSVKIHALSDANEDNLHNFFALFLSKNLNDKYSRASTALHSIIQDAGLPCIWNVKTFFEKKVLHVFIFLQNLSDYPDIPTPPPKFFV